MKIAVVIPNWNGADLISQCLQSLLNQSIKPEIIVVDNGSTDESVDIIETRFPDVTLVKLTTNTGFAGGVNAGIKYALSNHADYIALFNNDAIADKYWLQKLLEVATNTHAGITTGKLMRDDKIHFDSTGDFYSIYGIAFPRGRNEKDTGQYDNTEDVFGASGGASLYSTRMLKQIGLFDERFFAYFEDVDISFRAQLAGWKVIYTPEAVAYHHVGATSSKMGDFTRYHSIKNFLILYTKCMPLPLYFKYLPLFIYQFSRTTARSIIDLKIHIWLKAVSYIFINIPFILKDRYRIQSSRRISLSRVDSLLYKSKPPKIPRI